ncbi:MAG: hypothetical protein AB7R55_12970 [Gemmatimonadales bacterium]
MRKAFPDLAGNLVDSMVRRVQSVRAGNQQKLRRGELDPLARVCGLPIGFLRPAIDKNGRPVDDRRYYGNAADPGLAEGWATVHQCRVAFLGACLTAARRDYLADGGNPDLEEWHREYLQRVTGVFLHLIDPDHWRRRLTGAATDAMDDEEHAALTQQLAQTTLALLRPWLDGTHRIDYASLKAAGRLGRPRATDIRFLKRGVHVTAWHRMPPSEAGALGDELK